MTTIYHNPRCSKSRQTLALLEEQTNDITIVKYLDKTPTKADIEDLLKKLDIKAIDLVRKGEAVWKENFKGRELNEKETIDALVTFPKLIERPIVIKGDKAVLGRPPENVLQLF